MYTIFHPSFGALNTECVPGQFEYEQVAEFEAASLEKAFEQAQNDFNHEYEQLGLRSTSVGDIIKDDSDNSYYIVMKIGFKEVSPKWVTYVKWAK